MEIVQQVLAKAEIAALEDKLAILKSKFEERIASGVTKLKSYYAEHGEIVWDAIVSTDPTPNKTYLQWILSKGTKNWNKKTYKLWFEDLRKLKADLETYDIAKRKNLLIGKNKDINSIPNDIELFGIVHSVRQTIDAAELLSKAQRAKAEEQKFYDNREATLFFDSSDLKVVIPHSHEASMYFGKNTRWCTTMKNDPETFYDYSAAGPLYIILHKPTNRRWQFSFAEGQYMDEMDEEVDWSTFTKENFIGELRKALQKEAAKHNMIPLMDSYTDKQAMGYWDRVDSIHADVLSAYKKPISANVKAYMVKHLAGKWSIDSVGSVINFIDELYGDVSKAPGDAKASFVLDVIMKLRIKTTMLTLLVNNLWPDSDYPDILFSYLRGAMKNKEYNIPLLCSKMELSDTQWLLMAERGANTMLKAWMMTRQNKKDRIKALQLYVKAERGTNKWSVEILDFLFHPPFNFKPEELHKAGVLDDKEFNHFADIYYDQGHKD